MAYRISFLIIALLQIYGCAGHSAYGPTDWYGPTDKIVAEKLVYEAIPFGTDETIQLFGAGQWLPGQFGFKGDNAFTAVTSRVERGMLIITENALYFLQWQKEDQMYGISQRVSIADMKQILLHPYGKNRRISVLTSEPAMHTYYYITWESGVVDTNKVETAHTMLNSLAAEADIKAKIEAGWTPLMFASKNGDLKKVRLMLDNGADVNAVNSTGWTPLMVACFNGHIEIIKLLVKNKASVNTRNNNGTTALHFAALSENKEAIDLLVTARAKVYPNANSGEDSYATALGFQASALYFEGKGYMDKAGENYKNAAEYFTIATEQFENSYDEVANKKMNADIKNALGFLATVFTQAAVDSAAKYQAQQQSRQIAEISALKYAYDSGTGYSGYYRAVNKFRANYSPINQGSPKISYSSADTSELKYLKNLYAGLIKNSRKLSEQNNRISICFKRFRTKREIEVCKNNIKE